MSVEVETILPEKRNAYTCNSCIKGVAMNELKFGEAHKVVVRLCPDCREELSLQLIIII